MIFRFARRNTRGPRETDRGPDEAFGELLRGQMPRLRRYAVALAADVSFADDLVQDTMERALARRASLVDMELVYPWLRSILHNLHIDEIRRRRGRGTPVQIDDLADSLALSAPAADRGAARDFVRAMSDLSVEHRQILLLIGVEGLSYKEISEELGIPIGTVMSRVARAREQLRLKLDPPDKVISMPMARR